MPTPVRFEVLVNGEPVTGTVFRPVDASPDTPLPSVILCGGLPVEPPTFEELLDQIARMLAKSGIAAVVFRPRLIDLSAADPATYKGADSIDDAVAVLEWLSRRPGFDQRRVAVLGYSTGAVPTAGLCARTDGIAGLCLIAPVGAEDLSSRPGADGAASPGDLAPAPTEFLAAFQEVHPVEDTAVHDRPTLILHGAADRNVPADRAFRYVRRMQDASHQVDHMLIARGDHAFSGEEARVACLDRMMAFFVGLPSREPGEQPSVNGKAGRHQNQPSTPKQPKLPNKVSEPADGPA